MQIISVRDNENNIWKRNTHTHTKERKKERKKEINKGGHKL